MKSSLAQDRVFHAYMFCGPAGSGKTSAARIFAMALNCENLNDASPCLECTSCTQTLAFRNPDVIEMDGPSHGSVEHIRDIRQKTLHNPHFKRRIFIIDEVHSLSRDAFEALLKILEEPPSHVVFVLATTNPERVPATIQSRSIKLDFRRHTESDVVGRLRYVAKEEGIDLDQDASETVARFADGSLRDSLTVLEQLSTAESGASISAERVSDTLGVVSGTELESIMQQVLTKDAVELEKVLVTTLERSTEFGLIVRAITDWYRDVLRVKFGVEISRSASQMQLMRQYAAALSEDEIDAAIRLTWDMADRVRFSSSDPRTFFLTGLYRLMLLRPNGETDGPPPPAPSVEIKKPQATETPTFNASTAELEAQLKQLADEQS